MQPQYWKMTLTTAATRTAMENELTQSLVHEPSAWNKNIKTMVGSGRRTQYSISSVRLIITHCPASSAASSEPEDRLATAWKIPRFSFTSKYFHTRKPVPVANTIEIWLITFSETKPVMQAPGSCRFNVSKVKEATQHKPSPLNICPMRANRDRAPMIPSKKHQSMRTKQATGSAHQQQSPAADLRMNSTTPMIKEAPKMEPLDVVAA
mmetsp:Transcript_21188/g.43995  ORF Transcript_21188/g.43995 Transcript_21188/m.43995 type:complete len:208 (-) Transcript_21188:929-1552(-)